MLEPNPQNLIRPSDFEYLVESYGEAFSRIFKNLGTPVNKVRRIAELGCGRGPIVQAALNVCPFADIHAVDTSDILEKNIKKNPRVTFYHGKIIDVLKAGELVQLNAIILRGTESSHGLDNLNIQFLIKSLDRNGILITDYDNGNVEGLDWFRKKFQLILGNDVNWGLRVWKII